MLDCKREDDDIVEEINVNSFFWSHECDGAFQVWEEIGNDYEGEGGGGINRSGRKWVLFN